MAHFRKGSFSKALFFRGELLNYGGVPYRFLIVVSWFLDAMTSSHEFFAGERPVLGVLKNFGPRVWVGPRGPARDEMLPSLCGDYFINQHKDPTISWEISEFLFSLAQIGFGLTTLTEKSEGIMLMVLPKYALQRRGIGLVFADLLDHDRYSRYLTTPFQSSSLRTTCWVQQMFSFTIDCSWQTCLANIAWRRSQAQAWCVRRSSTEHEVARGLNKLSSVLCMVAVGGEERIT